jgi:hypothetical protein
MTTRDDSLTDPGKNLLALSYGLRRLRGAYLAAQVLPVLQLGRIAAI